MKLQENTGHEYERGTLVEMNNGTAHFRMVRPVCDRKPKPDYPGPTLWYHTILYLRDKILNEVRCNFYVTPHQVVLCFIGSIFAQTQAV